MAMRWMIVPVVASVLLALSGAVVSADDYQVEIVDEAAPADAVSPEIAATLAPRGMRIKRGGTRTICTIWSCKQWDVQPDFSPSLAILYPLRPGALVGVIHYPRRAEDFRVQEIPSGTYTLRYALQPEDGSHVGTSDTRDFLLVLPAEQDTSAGILGEEPLLELSTETAGGTHPTMLSLLRATAEGELPAMHHDEARDWWSLRWQGVAVAGQNASPLVVQLVVVGHAAE